MTDYRVTVGIIYEALGRGDVAAIFDQSAEDVQWEYAWTASPMPWLAPGFGRDHAARFFGALADQREFNYFAVNHALAGDGLAAALVRLDAPVRATGKRILETDEAHSWWFDDAGCVRMFRHAADTYQRVQAL